MTALSRKLSLQVWIPSDFFLPPLNFGLADYIKSTLSIVVASLSDPSMAVRILGPYLLLLASFGFFVIWNGGVVLGKPISVMLRNRASSQELGIAKSCSLRATISIVCEVAQIFPAIVKPLIVNFRRQGEPRCLTSLSSDAVRLAVHCILLPPNALALAPERHCSSVSTPPSTPVPSS